MIDGRHTATIGKEAVKFTKPNYHVPNYFLSQHEEFLIHAYENGSERSHKLKH